MKTLDNALADVLLTHREVCIAQRTKDLIFGIGAYGSETIPEFCDYLLISILIDCVGVSGWTYIHGCKRCGREPKVSDYLELELWAVGYHSIWVQGTKLSL